MKNIINNYTFKTIVIFCFLILSCGIAKGYDAVSTKYLLEAAVSGDLAVVKSVLGKGADKNGRDADGWTPLMLATLHGHVDIVKHLLIFEPDVNAKQPNGIDALIIASTKGHASIVKILLLSDANPNNKVKGLTALDYAKKKGHRDVVQILEDKTAKKQISKKATKKKDLRPKDFPEVSELVYEHPSLINSPKPKVYGHTKSIKHLFNKKVMNEIKADIVYFDADNLSRRYYSLYNDQYEDTVTILGGLLEIHTKNQFSNSPYVLKRNITKVDGSLFPIKIGNELSISYEVLRGPGQCPNDTRTDKYSVREKINTNSNKYENIFIIHKEISGTGYMLNTKGVCDKFDKKESSTVLYDAERSIVITEYASIESNDYVNNTELFKSDLSNLVIHDKNYSREFLDVHFNKKHDDKIIEVIK